MDAEYSQAYSNGNRQNDIADHSLTYMLAGMTVGDRIRERLELLGISQSELARRVKISQPTINALVNGDATGSKHLHRIAAELETSPAYLCGETDDSAPVAPRTSTIEALADEL